MKLSCYSDPDDSSLSHFLSRSSVFKPPPSLRPLVCLPPLRLCCFSNLPQWRIPHLPPIIRYFHRPERLILRESITPRVTLLPFASTGMFFSLIVGVYIPHLLLITNGPVLHYGHYRNHTGSCMPPTAKRPFYTSGVVAKNVWKHMLSMLNSRMLQRSFGFFLPYFLLSFVSFFVHSRQKHQPGQDKRKL